MGRARCRPAGVGYNLADQPDQSKNAHFFSASVSWPAKGNQLRASTKDRAKIEKRDIAGQKVTVVDLTGTYMDRPGPMAPGVERPNYRMLGAIIETKSNGNHFIKFYGPQRTVSENADAFAKMLDSLRPK
jgi:hypothetical protein